MSNATRKLLLAEAALLLAPATVLAALGFAWSARFLTTALVRGNWQDPTTWMAVAIAAGLLGTLAGWWLIVRYLRGGRVALVNGAGPAWIGAVIGMSAALYGAWMALQGNGWVFASGLLALVPFFHLWRLRVPAGAARD
jgi:hypothetical protein